MKQQIILLRGLPGSGKTTWALQEMADHPGVYKRVNKDLLRAMLDDGAYSDLNELFVQDIRNRIITTALMCGYSIIVDDTNLNLQHETDIRNIFDNWADIIVKSFEDVPLEECIARDAARAKPVGEEVIRGMWQKYLAPKEAGQ
jgi:predicted kinase